MTDELLRLCLMLVALGVVVVVGLIWASNAPTPSRDADFRRFMDSHIPPRKGREKCPRCGKMGDAK